MSNHGLSKTNIYKRWTIMKRRCNNPNHATYRYYGGRGISVCKEWQTFEMFYTWSLKSGYQPNLTLDRIDNMGDYSPNNCRWIDMKAQCRNRRSNIKYKGEIASIASIRLGGNKQLVDNRIRKGWDIKKAFTEKTRPHKKYKNSKIIRMWASSPKFDEQVEELNRLMGTEF